MLNGKFYTGLPPKMIARDRQMPNRMESHLFWPDDTQSVPVTEAKSQRRGGRTVSYTSSEVGPSPETKERFKNEFSKSHIAFNDTKEMPFKRKDDFGVSENKNNAKRHSSKIQFYDFVEEFNNVSKPDKNVKKEVELNNKNSPKLQNKKLSFEESGINIIENKVKNVSISEPPKKSILKAEDYEKSNSRPPQRMDNDRIWKGPPRRRSPPRRDFYDEYDSGDRRRYVDRPQYPSSRQPARHPDEYDADYDYQRGRRSPPRRYRAREDDYDRCDEYSRRSASPVAAAQPQPPTERVVKVERHTTSTPAPADRSEKSSLNATTAPTSTASVSRRQNIRSSAFSRVSVGLPD